MVYEGLTRVCQDGTSELALAESVDISPDGRVYVFHLREALWSDGTKISAYDFEAAWKASLDPSSPSFSCYLLYPILNAEAVVQGKLPMSELGILAEDEKVLRVELTHPTPHFLNTTYLSPFLPTPSFNKEKKALFNGPFVIASMTQRGEIRLEKNPLFWNAENIHLDAISIAIVADETTALRMFESGDLDWIGGALSPIPADAIDSLREEQKEILRFLPASATTFCSFNTQAFPFHNENLRKAFAYAIDPSLIVQQIGQGTIPNRVVPPVLFKTEPTPLFRPYQPELSRLYLAEALRELNISADELKSITLYYGSGQTEKRVAMALIHQWKTNLGIEISTTQMEYKMHKDRLHRRDYQVSLASWIAQYHDPMNILERFKDPSNLKNYPAWDNHQFALLLEAANLTAIFEEKRLALLETAEKLLLEEMPFVPIYHWSHPCLCSPRIQNLSICPCGATLFERAWVKE